MRGFVFQLRRFGSDGAWPFAPTDLNLANPLVAGGGADAGFVCSGGDPFASSDKGRGLESELRRIRS